MVLKKLKKVFKQTKEGFQVGGAGYKGIVTGKGVKPAKDLAKKFRKSDLKIQAKSGKTTRSRMEAKQRLTHGDEAINNLQKQHKAWKKMRSGETSKADFIKKFPNSNTAKKAAKRKQPRGKRGGLK